MFTDSRQHADNTYFNHDVSTEPHKLAEGYPVRQNILIRFEKIAQVTQVTLLTVELVHSMPAHVVALNKAKAHLPNTVLGLILCHHVSIK